MHTRPYVATLTNKTAQVTLLTFSIDKVRDRNKDIRRVCFFPRRGLTYKLLDQKIVHLRIYADASHATNDDLFTQLGYLNLLADASNSCHVFGYASHISRRDVKSIMEEVSRALLNAFDASFALSADLKTALDKESEIAMFTNLKQLYGNLVQHKWIMER